MARLLALATLVAGAMATYNSGSNYGGSNYGNSNNYGGGSSSQTIEVTVGITIVSSCNGGGAPMNTIAPPPMATTGMMHQVVVGGNAGLVYTPPSISAAVGDMVEFVFMSANHTVTQSTFPLPCVKMQGGVDSGFMPNANNTVNPPPSMMFQVTTTSPIWMYCRQKTPTSHCGKGMVFSINPTADKTQAQFMQMAIQQNGTASSMAPPPPASTMAAPPPPPPPATMAAPPPPSATGIVSGSGSSSGGSCSCSCLCAVEAFPVGDGIGMWGGMSGYLPASYMK